MGEPQRRSPMHGPVLPHRRTLVVQLACVLGLCTMSSLAAPGSPGARRGHGDGGGAQPAGAIASLPPGPPTRPAAHLPGARPSPLPSTSQRVVDYTIEARLDASTHEVHGRERLVWRNPSDDAVSDVWFHLYLNAFRNSRSTFYVESGGRLRSDDMPPDGWGFVDVTAIRLADGTDLTRALTFEAPDDGNGEDRTVARLPLPAPVPPRGMVALDVEFRSKLPRVFARTGYHDDFHLVAQWFPKIAVYEPAGRRGRRTGGWNAHQFHANSEFYADFGRYDVSITVPREFVVGATGERRHRRENADGTVTYRYVQDDVHDFAWTADPDFVERRYRFSAASEVTPQEYRRAADLLGRRIEELRLSDVEIVLLVQPRHLAQADRYLRAARLGLKWFGLWYGAYPYRTLTIVDPAPGALGAGGMEYPTFITGGTSFVFNRGPFEDVRLVEEVTLHEFGHQYWYGLVANNEFEEAWLDEGLTSYSTGKVMDLAYGAAAVAEALGLRLGTLDVARLGNRPDRRHDAVRQPAWTYQPRNYGFYSYEKPELLLRTLEHHLGADTMARIMRTYHERWRFGHPGSDDFYATANEVAGRDLSWFFEQAVESPAVLDYEVASVSTGPNGAASGYLGADAGSGFVSELRPAGDAPPRDALHESTVLVRRNGTFVFPVEIELTFRGGHRERLPWDGRATWTRIQRVRSEPLERAEVDPDRKVVLDAVWANNGRRVDADARAASTWSLRLGFWIQQLVASVGW